MKTKTYTYYFSSGGRVLRLSSAAGPIALDVSLRIRLYIRVRWLPATLCMVHATTAPKVWT